MTYNWTAADIRPGCIAIMPTRHGERNLIGRMSSAPGKFILASLQDGFTSEPTTGEHMARVLNQFGAVPEDTK
jgi:hypothetical protein